MKTKTFRQTACGLIMAACALPAVAETFPTRAITLVVPHSAGGTTDILARTIAKEAGKTLGQTIVVDNKGGANGSIAANTVGTSEPDGYTLLVATASTHGINPSLYKKLNYDAIKDFAPVTLLATVPNVLVVNKNIPATNLEQLTAAIKADSNGFNMASAGAGTPGHLAGEMYKQRSGLDFVHVPYKGGSPALADLVGGQVQFMFTTIPGAMPSLKSNSVRALAVTSPQRSPALPDVPTMAEAGLPEFQALSWHGIVAPDGTPAETIEVLNAAFGKALASPEVRQRLLEEGALASGMGPKEFGPFIQNEIDTWAKAVQASGATAN